ncbi:MAG: copper chaperone PCu(A)C [Jatrophihabitantaceae bacterium]
MSRPPASVLAAAVVLVAGLVGLVRGALPQSTATPVAASSSSAGMSMGIGTGMSPDMAIVVNGAYVRQPANLVNAAAYLTVFNATDTPETLVSVASGAGARTSVHTETASGGMQPSGGGLPVPAHGSLALTPGKGHVMIESLYGRLVAGQTVNLSLMFAKAGQVLVTAPVIGVTASAPSPVDTP